VKVFRINTEVKLPTVAHPGEDNAYDLYLPVGIILERNEPTRVPLGIAASQEGCGFLIVGRSRTFIDNVIVTPGLIDAGYRGEWHVLATYVGPKPRIFLMEGDRIAQAVPLPVLTAAVTEVAGRINLGPSVRGERGLGSSGR